MLVSRAGSLWKLPCDPFPSFFCILREAARAWGISRASGQGSVRCCLQQSQVPFQLENSTALLLWGSGLFFLFIGLGLAVT